MKLARCFITICATIALSGWGAAWAQPVIPGSTAFCLYEVPVDDDGKRRWINLGIVQYVELTDTKLTIYYGGGAFGAGHETRYTIENPAQALAILQKMRAVASACR